jgi:purine-nucleoside phosphorylase
MDCLAGELNAAVEAWGNRGWPRPKLLIVSGSGLAVDLPGTLEMRVPLAELLPFDTRAVVGHPLQVELLSPGALGPVLYQRGRLHSYQGYDAHQTVFMIRLAGLLGAGTLVMTNAAGGLREGLSPGDLAVIRDQINLTGLNPLRGQLPEQWGPQFPDMLEAHNQDLRQVASEVARELRIPLTEGIYAGLAGPSYETAAEVEMLRRVGADLAGMSTVLEVIAARHLGMRSLCFSLVSNLAAGVDGMPLDHAEVLDAGREAAERIGQLLSGLIWRPELYHERRAGQE